MAEKKGKVVFGGNEHPWLDPLWRRVVLVLFCAGWTAVEYFHDNITWAIIVAAITAYAVWAYLIAYGKPDTLPPVDRQDPDSSD